MKTYEVWVHTGQHEARASFSSDGLRVAVGFGEAHHEVMSDASGMALWATLRQSGVNAQEINGFDLHEGSSGGRRIATLRPVLEGARVVWLVLYRADRSAGAFRPLGTRQRIGDAFEACFAAIRADLQLPHKP